MLDDFRLEWLCRRTSKIFNVDREVFLETIERNEHLIDRFWNQNGRFHELSFALIFERQVHKKVLWKIIEIIDENDDQDEQQISLVFNRSIDDQTEFLGKMNLLFFVLVRRSTNNEKLLTKF